MGKSENMSEIVNEKDIILRTESVSHHIEADQTDSVSHPSPRTLFIEITTECNLRCRQCHMWISREEPTTLSTAEKLGLVTQYAQMAPGGGVVLTGGEPFTKLEEVIALSSACRDLGLLSVVNTNGTVIPPSAIPRLLAEGPKHLVISLDSQHASLHDYVRNTIGAFETTMSLIQSLIRYRSNAATDVKIFLSSILFDQNISDSPSYIEFAKDLGVDGVTFQMLEGTFQLRGKVDKFFERHWFTDSVLAKSAIDKLAALYEDDPFLLLSSDDLRSMKSYIDHPHTLPNPVCGAHERNLVVDMRGNVQLCAYMKTLSGGQPIGNVRKASLSEMWNSEFAANIRPLMATCKRSCGMLNCNRK